VLNPFLVMAAAALLQQPPCDALKSISLPHATITSAEFVAAGSPAPGRGGRGGKGAPLPAHCKVAATLAPSADSHIEMELWLPTDNWNGKFLMPGVGHCGGGVGPDQADFLGAIERWREQGVAPGQIIATRSAGRGGQPSSPEVSGAPRPPMSRPLCPYSQVARYSGSGSTDDANSFACVAP
jgi:hypothetical protein